MIGLSRTSIASVHCPDTGIQGLTLLKPLYSREEIIFSIYERVTTFQHMVFTDMLIKIGVNVMDSCVWVPTYSAFCHYFTLTLIDNNSHNNNE